MANQKRSMDFYFSRMEQRMLENEYMLAPYTNENDEYILHI